MRVRIVNNFKPLYIGDKQCLSFRMGKLYYHPSITDKPIYLGALPMTKMQKILSKQRLTERIMRLEPRTTLEISEGKYLVSFAGAIYFVDIQKRKILCEHRFRQGMSNPLNFCKIEGITGFHDCIAYGEYWGNAGREEVSVYTRRGMTWEKKFTFPKRKIRHIHGIIADKYRDCVLILTGDKDSESGIWRARNDFREVEPILYGSQLYRVCVAFPIEEGILYAMDSAHKNNSIVLASLDSSAWKTEILYDMPGACMYGTKNADKFIFSTSVEPSGAYGRIRNLFSYELAKGVKDRKSHIIVGNLSEGFQDIIALKKDFLPMGLCQFGNIQFPDGQKRDRIVMYPVSVNKYDGQTCLL
ncbi:hypothetical protein [Desulfosporosinus meridiei]|uniref:Uncharacterized protein n=1 Tax=Desulfosporosinus meridiei (strain ATCC BAA-275 / DSM 13257 / KCTC 12902 / NCIMB 13706 / S10) TaxID=768704 RepID=J7IW54_DESMD|nr:hypothetical protein [Desulfosporosinus meridiei]AFQ45975.1 hypothetical protein Desmer_4146 [Desulfosporosinus meridiei DSM 13257]